MIKKFLFCLLISFLSFVSFSSAEWVIRDNGLYGYSTLDTNIDLNVVNKGQILSQRFGTTKRMLAFTSKTNSSNQQERIFFFWSDGQKPYYFVNYHDKFYQGFLKTYYLCPLDFSGVSSTFYGCSKHDITDNFAVEVGGLFDSMTINDNWGYEIRTWTCYGIEQLINRVCFSSSSSNSSICFGAGNPTNTQVCACYDCDNVTDSLDILSGVDFTQINDDLLSTPPGFQYSSGGNIDGSSSVGENTNLSGNLMYSTCTNGYVVSEISSWYGGISNICYAGTNNTGIINDSVSRTPIAHGLNFKEVYNGSLNVTINGVTPYYSSYLDWFNTWMYAMQKYKLGQIDFNIFNGQPVYLYAYFDRLYQNGVVPGQTDAYNIANICKLALFSDYSKEYKGTYFKDVCDSLNYNPGISGDVSTGEVGSIDDDLQEIIPPGSDIGTGNISSSGTIVSVDWSGTLSGNTNKNFDGKTFINDFYQKLQSNFQKPTNVNNLTGIVPVYIYVFLIALVLFRFLSH